MAGRDKLFLPKKNFSRVNANEKKPHSLCPPHRYCVAGKRGNAAEEAQTPSYCASLNPEIPSSSQSALRSALSRSLL